MKYLAKTIWEKIKPDREALKTFLCIIASTSTVAAILLLPTWLISSLANLTFREALFYVWLFIGLAGLLYAMGMAFYKMIAFFIEVIKEAKKQKAAEKAAKREE